MSNRVIDLSIRSDDEPSVSSPKKKRKRPLQTNSTSVQRDGEQDSLDDVEIIASPNLHKRIRVQICVEPGSKLGISRRKAKEKNRRAETFQDEEYDDDILIKDGSQFVSSTRFIQSREDAELARKLAEEEQAGYQQLLKSVKSKEEGIIFRLAINTANNTLEDGTPAHRDDIERFRPWKEICDKAGIRLKRFHWIVNHESEKRYNRARKYLEYFTGKKWPEKKLFHGTHTQNIELILKGGFRIGGVDGHPIRHGDSEGKGVYLAEDPRHSMGFSPPTQAGQTTCRIFCCRVVPGRVTRSLQYSRKVPPSKDVGQEKYESFRGYDGGSPIYVVRYTSLILPCYMIEYELPFNQVPLALMNANFG
ncbi:hypothetical protein DL96DRAFT_1584341 [Flagelloscypha sp. PMI_526]|nr:hypothetical protein DL96DRAFT_1584341 [Flagelloscypha sp. PMI_526]